MVMERRFIKNSAAVFAVTVLILSLAGCGKTVESGATWEVSETASLSGLTIAEDAVIKAPEGKSLTMTVDGVETQIAAGNYRGKIVLTVSDEIIVDYRGTDKYRFRTAVYVRDGKYVPEKSVAASVVGGAVTDTALSNARITSVGDRFNGIIVTGDSRYSIDNTVISMTGNGGNDFAGFGASIMTDGNAEVTIENATIRNTGRMIDRIRSIIALHTLLQRRPDPVAGALEASHQDAGRRKCSR